MKKKRKRWIKPKFKSIKTISCPLCGNSILVDYYGNYGELDAYCTNTVTLPNNKVKSHYRILFSDVEAIILPFKIYTRRYTSKIYILNKKAKPTSNAQFKKIAEVPAINITSREQLLNKLNLINIIA